MSNEDLMQLPPYDTVDFKALAKRDDPFKATWQKNSGRLDFQDPDITKVLTKAILRTDFGLDLEVPDDRLCPPIPNRWNYCAWIQSMIDSTSPDYQSSAASEREIVGLDIGTGASAIYTMLCLKTRPSWTMCATDIDKKSFDSAVRNLTINGLVTRTKMLQTISSNPLIPLQHLGVDKLDFTVCNPPFFVDAEEMRSSLKGEGKSRKPNAVCTGAEVEMVCPGGDVGFVTRIVNESLMLGEKVAWYTSMVGKLESAKTIVNLLKKHGVSNWAVGCIEAGSTTKRWIVAWSFADYRPRNDIARIEGIANEYLPFPTSYRIDLPPAIPPEAARGIIDTHLTLLDLRWMWNDERWIGIGEASQNVWKRAYRREYERKKRQLAAAGTLDADMEGQSEGNVALAFRVNVDGGESEVVLEWLKGRDQVLWESFCGMMHQLFKKT